MCLWRKSKENHLKEVVNITTYPLKILVEENKKLILHKINKWHNYRVNKNQVSLINSIYSQFLWTVRCESGISFLRGHKILTCIYSKGWLGNGMIGRLQRS